MYTQQNAQQMQQAQAVVTPDRTGRFVSLGDHRGYIKVSSDDNGGDFMLFDMEVDPNGGTPPHIHTREDETFYILTGRFTLRIGDDVYQAGPGDTVFAPRNIPHFWQCTSPRGGRALVLITPGGNFESFATQMDREEIVSLDPESIARLIAVATQHGLQILPPTK